MAKKTDRNKRAVRDQAGVGPEPAEARHLTPMKELKKYRMVSGEPDIRDWNVYTSNGREIGKVADLLVDTSSGEVVMMDIDLRDSDRQTLAPLRAGWVDRDAKRVVLDGAQFDAEEEIPSLRRGDMTEEEARAFGERYVRAYGDRGFGGNSDYRVGRGTGELRFGRRQRERDTERDDYVVEHGARGSRAHASDDDTERDVRYPVREGEEVVRSRPVIVEETVVRRRVVDEGDSEREESAERADERHPRGDTPEERR